MVRGGKTVGARLIGSLFSARLVCQIVRRLKTAYNGNLHADIHGTRGRGRAHYYEQRQEKGSRPVQEQSRYLVAGLPGLSVYVIDKHESD